MLELFVMGTIWFWILVCVSVFLSCLAIKFEEGWGATITLIGTFLLLGIFGNFNIIREIQTNPLIAFMAITIYVLIGIGWSFFKLAISIRKKNKKYIKEKEEYFKKYPEHTEEDWLRLNGTDLRGHELYKYKKQILLWSMFWACSSN